MYLLISYDQIFMLKKPYWSEIMGYTTSGKYFSATDLIIDFDHYEQ